MEGTKDLSALYTAFLARYDPNEKDRLWKGHRDKFRAFWYERVGSADPAEIPDAVCDEVIRILDRNGKGNTRDSEAVAKAMVAQGAWRRMFNEFHSNRELRDVITHFLEESDPQRKAAFIDELYARNEGHRNNVTGPSGNTVGAFLAAYDPVNNLSMISLRDRRAAMESFGVPAPFDWERDSIGTRIVESNRAIVDAMRARGVEGSARTIACFFYFPTVQALWKDAHTVKRADKSVSVTVPVQTEPEEGETVDDTETVRESMQIQALLAKIGASMGFSIWLPRSDRGRVLKAWRAREGELVDELPLAYDSTTMKTIEQIDVLWLRKRSIVRAFEVEHTTSVYSGLLRMADLVALQPNITIKLHIVAPAGKREKVLQEIQRPVFSLLEGRALSEMCTFLSYDSVKELAGQKHLTHLSDNVLDEYEESAE